MQGVLLKCVEQIRGPGGNIDPLAPLVSNIYSVKQYDSYFDPLNPMQKVHRIVFEGMLPGQSMLLNDVGLVRYFSPVRKPSIQVFYDILNNPGELNEEETEE